MIRRPSKTPLTSYYGHRNHADVCVSCPHAIDSPTARHVPLGNRDRVCVVVHKEEQPEVLLTNITPLESTPFEQRLKVDLRVRNPNDYDLQVTGLDFRLEMNGKSLARGLGNKELTVPH